MKRAVPEEPLTALPHIRAQIFLDQINNVANDCHAMFLDEP
jgi:hypothetical protein